MPAARSQSVLVTAARLYYLEGKSQGEVARAIGVSRSSVSRILAAARDQGIVEIRIHTEGPLSRRTDLEESLRPYCGGTRVYVASRQNGRRPVDSVASLGARLFAQRVSTLASVGLSWGVTVARFVDEVLVEPIYSQLDVWALMGGLPTTGPAGNVSVERIARKCGGTSHRFEAPAVVESRNTWQALRGESSVRQAVAGAAGVQAAFVGLGAMGFHSSPIVVQAMHLDASENAQFLAQRPAGDICGHFYDLTGRVLGPPTSERVIGISLEQLAKVPETFGLVAGREKALGTVGAIRTGVLDGIVMDEDLATDVLEGLRTSA
jgi:DNA-binding transcriptional regulator LsrR (DeoR family)